MTTSIWKDTFFDVPASASPYSYSITTGSNETVFNGRAYVAPDKEVIEIGVNKIAQDYLAMEFPSAGLASTGNTITVQHPDAFKTFVIRHGGYPVETYSFLLDWSGKNRNFNSPIQLSTPINGKGTTGMYYFSTYWTSANGVTTKVNTTPSAVTDVQGHALYHDAGLCCDWAIYYLDRNCGWCSFLVEGTVKRYDEYNRYNITRHYKNTTREWGKKTYNNQITTSYEIHTGWLKDDESENLAFNLLSSNQVYLHNLKDNSIVPVVLNDTRTEYKTYRNNGKKFVNYVINVTLSQTQQNIS